MRRMVVCSVAAIFLLVFTGCEKAGEKTAEKLVEKAIESRSEESVDVDISEGKVTITSQDEESGARMQYSGGDDLGLPEGFPEDVPVFPRAKVVSFLQQGSENQQTLFQAPSPGPEVYAFFLEKLRGEGWEIVQEMKMPPTYNLMGRKQGRFTTVIINEEGGASTISVTVAEHLG